MLEQVALTLSPLNRWVYLHYELTTKNACEAECSTNAVDAACVMNVA